MQRIMITHNFKLAVVADAEKIIRINIEKEKNHKVTIISGSIETPVINKSIIDVLEVLQTE